jgi:hypothetical protein
MSKHDPDLPQSPATDVVPMDRAHAALRRAAQLQADAVERLEQSARARAADDDTAAPVDGLGRAEIEAAAAGAGISPEFVRQALLEQERPVEDGGEVAPWMSKVADRVLRTPQRTLELRRTIQAAPEAVLAGMQAVLPASPYDLTLVDCVGAGPLDGGVLVFGLPRMAMGSAYTPFAYTVYAAGLQPVHVSIHPVHGSDGAACEVVLRGDLRRSVRLNVWACTAITGVGASLGALAVTTASIASGGLLPLVAAGAIAAAGGMGTASGVGYGAMYRHYLRKLEGELETMLRVIDVQARTGGGFGAPQPRVTPAASPLALLGFG